jgi:hypothetical protein
MKKASTKRVNDDLRPEYDLTQLTGGVRGKYYRQAVAGTNLMLIEPELAEVFRDSESVKRLPALLVVAIGWLTRRRSGRRKRRAAAERQLVSRTRIAGRPSTRPSGPPRAAGGGKVQ